MNDFLSSIWIYFFSFCLSFQLNCSSHLLRRSGRSPPNLALKRMVFREGSQWTTLPLGISLVGKTHEIAVVHQHIISEQTKVQLKLEWGSGVFNTQAQGKGQGNVPETKATTELYILWMHHRKLQDCWHNETLFWDIDLHFALKEWHQRAPSQVNLHTLHWNIFRLPVFKSKCPRLYLEYINRV